VNVVLGRFDRRVDDVENDLSIDVFASLELNGDACRHCRRSCSDENLEADEKWRERGGDEEEEEGRVSCCSSIVQKETDRGWVETYRMVMAEIRMKSHARNVQLNLIM